MLNSLFWKIFLTIWFTNMAIAISSAFTIAYLADQEEYRQAIEYKGNTQALSALNQSSTTLKNLSNKKLDDAPLVMAIYDHTNQHLFGPTDLDPEQSLEWTLRTDDGNQYRLTALVPEQASAEQLTAHFRHINISLMLSITGLASLILTLLLTRPLKKLTAFTRELGQGKLDNRLSHNMMSRNDEIGSLSSSLNSMAGELQQLIENKHRLLHDVSHELRAPLARLSVATELVVDDIEVERNPKKRQYADRIQQEVQTLEQMIDEIIVLARLDQHPVELTSHSPQNIVEQCVNDARFSQPGRVFQLNLNHINTITCDAELLKKALSNIIGNALKYTPADSPIDIDVTQSQDNTVITVRDHGKGIAPSMLQNVFEPFKQLSNKSSGYGLGLAIVKRAIEAQNGKIAVFNHPDGGLVFEISLSNQ